MKIKTFRLKATSEQANYDYNEFLEGSNTVYSTNIEFVKEKEGYYWYILITYEPRQTFSYQSPSPPLPQGFKEAIEDYTFKKNPPNSTRVQNGILAHTKKLLDIKKMEDFHMLSGIGRQSLAKDHDYLTGILAIIKKYQLPNE